MAGNDSADRGFGSELVIGLVSAIGTDLDAPQSILTDQLHAFGYKVTPLRLSGLAEDQARKLGVELKDSPECERIRTHMKAGNTLREHFRDDWLALQTLAVINVERRGPPGKTAYIVRSLKHPKEVEMLRQTYGPGFFLVAVYSSEQERLEYLTKTKGCAEQDARDLIRIDMEEEDDPHGQRTRRTFALADVFIDRDSQTFEQKLRDFLSLAFGHPFITPEPDEYAMFLAFAASLRSASLGRQVGAVVTGASGDVIGTGCNDVPRAGGGLYWPGTGDKRDHVREYDSNDRRRDEIVSDVFTRLSGARMLREGTDAASVKAALATSILHEITEYGRSVHAEMEALLSCARNGISVANGTLFTTTFPCHNCAKHIVAAGIQRVVYVEPYPKSKATDLHADAIALEGSNKNRVAFVPFVGIGPRRFVELFSLELGAGRHIERKHEGVIVKWDSATARLRAPMPLLDYLDLEKAAATGFEDLTVPKSAAASTLPSGTPRP
jgi:deoxycytidylate deaminase